MLLIQFIINLLKMFKVILIGVLLNVALIQVAKGKECQTTYDCQEWERCIRKGVSFGEFMSQLLTTSQRKRDFVDVCQYDDERAKRYNKKQEEEENKKKYRNYSENCTNNGDCGYALFCYRQPFKQGHCEYRMGQYVSED